MKIDKKSDGMSNRCYILGSIYLGVFIAFYFLYTIHTNSFAKIHIELPLINIPLFIGEMFLAFALVLYFLYPKDSNFELTPLTLITIGYISIVLLKTLVGIIFCGPLALRHAALFYYPIIAIISYKLYTGIKFRIFLPLLLLLIFVFYTPTIYNYTNLLLIVAILYIGIPNKIYKFITIAVFCLVYEYFAQVLHVNRAAFISIIFSVGILAIILTYRVLRTSWRRYVFSGFFVVAIILTLGVLNNDVRLKSMVSIKDFLKHYNEARLETKDAVLKPNWGVYDRKIPTKLYNEQEFEYQNRSFLLSEARNNESNSKITNTMSIEERNKQYNRTLELENANTTWRLFLWEDMLSDLLNDNIYIGVQFGKPIRSKRIELWKASPGINVGWLEPHNSYFHVIYRTGIVGIFIILIYFTIVYKLTIKAVRTHQIELLLLTAILHFWLMYPNFHVVLELPYTAIPWWGMFGFIAAHIDHEFRNRTVSAA